jgi:hypothetical protein
MNFCTISYVMGYCLACTNATTTFQNLVNTCWNLTLNASASGADMCTCWTSSALAASALTIKSCDCKFTLDYSWLDLIVWT